MNRPRTSESGIDPVCIKLRAALGGNEKPLCSHVGNDPAHCDVKLGSSIKLKCFDKAVPGKFEDRVRHLVAIDVSMARATNLLADRVEALESSQTALRQ